MTLNYDAPWYHGSPRADLTLLLTDSAVTQRRDTARAFSHKPSFVGTGKRGVRHNGTVEPGYLYRVAERLTPDDVVCGDFEGNEDRIEWHILRPVRVELVEQVAIVPEEFITAEQMVAMKRAHP